jgi:arsenate reductase (thioredoxin)
MMERPFNVLFICTGNSARSIIGEAILNKLGAGKFHAYSAGSHPKGNVHPETLRLLQSLGYDTSGFRSKSWEVFAARDAPKFDFVFTVCDDAAGEACPFWPGQPMTAHWGVPDPAQATGAPAEIAVAFKDAYRMLHQRIAIFLSLPLRSLDQLTLQARLKDIGRSGRQRRRRNRRDAVFGTALRCRMPGSSLPARCCGRLRDHGREASRR